jgi:UDP-N-acetylglucosamine 1-carboxyvinyltransferase
MERLKVSKSVVQGTINLSGAKNSALRLLAASILTSDEVVLKRYPSKLLDAQIHVQMLEKLGKKCEVEDESILIAEGELNTELNWEDRSIRNTLLILGALTARKGSGSVPLPGGCKLGNRAYDLHEMLLRKLGAEVWEEDGQLCAAAPDGGLVGADIYLPIRSTGATENAIICGSLAKGVTRIWNPHIRPEIIDLINMLKSMGAEIVVYGQERIDVSGVTSLSGTTHVVIPDNMEAITWLVASVMTNGDVEIVDFPLMDLEVPLIHLRESGAKFYVGDNSLIVRGGRCFPLEISTGPHPGINSDVQPILAAYAACAEGNSSIVDLRFPGRYGYAEEMSKMGLSSHVEGNLLRIEGLGGALVGANVTALDLRAGMALLLCGMRAEGVTTIENAWQIFRGYNDLESKLSALGVNFELE